MKRTTTLLKQTTVIKQILSDDSRLQKPVLPITRIGVGSQQLGGRRCVETCQYSRMSVELCSNELLMLLLAFTTTMVLHPGGRCSNRINFVTD